MPGDLAPPKAGQGCLKIGFLDLLGELDACRRRRGAVRIVCEIVVQRSVGVCLPVMVLEVYPKRRQKSLNLTAILCIPGNESLTDDWR